MKLQLTVKQPNPGLGLVDEKVHLRAKIKFQKVSHKCTPTADMEQAAVECIERKVRLVLL